MSQENSRGTLPDSHRKVDKRYRESQYFLMDQLRYSESVEDLRSIKQFINRSVGFNIGQRSFQFANASVEVRR